MIEDILPRLIESFHDDLESRRLLEEVDAESLTYSLLDVVRPSPAVYGTWLSAAGLGVAVGAAYYRGGFPAALAITGLGFVPFVTRSAVVVLSRHHLGYVSKSLEMSLADVRSVYATLRQKDTVSFSLGLSAPRRAEFRVRVFLMCRRLVQVLAAAAEVLVTEHEGLSEESTHLIYSFYTDDISQLMSDSVHADSSHVTDRGIGTLLDLAVLHRSELSRLMLLALTSCVSIGRLWNLHLFFREVVRNLAEIQDQATVLLSVSASRVVEPRPQAGKSRATSAPLQQVACALDDIAQSILEEKVSTLQVQRALQRVLAMSAFAQKRTPENTKQKERVLDDETVLEPNVIFGPSGVVVDQVFETIAGSADGDTEDFDEMFDILPAAPDASLMGELRNALGEKSREFEVRERKALAAFYGITEQELERREREEREVEEEQQTEEEEVHEAVGSGDGASWVPPPRPLMPVPSDLLAALRARQNNADVTIGDSDSD